MQRLKIILAIVGLLIVGFVGGFLTNRYFVETKIHQLRRMDAGESFGQILLEKIQADEEQTAKLEPLLADFGQRFKMLRETHLIERRALTDSLFQTMAPILSEEQLKKSQEWRRFLSRGKRRGFKER